VKKPDVIQKNELYFCNQGFNVIQNQLSKSKHRLKSFVLQACVMNNRIYSEVLYTICQCKMWYFRERSRKENLSDN
jgi:hypothetical protein